MKRQRCIFFLPPEIFSSQLTSASSSANGYRFSEVIFRALHSKYSNRSCLPSSAQASISSCSSLSLVLASCRSLCLCLVSASNLSPSALVSLFLGIQEGKPLYCLFTKVCCRNKKGLLALSSMCLPLGW
jgi:hypothetical protein